MKSDLNTNVPLTKDQWNRLDGKAQWDIMSALRGPDVSYSHSSNLKYFGTAVIRGKMREVIRVGGMVNTDLSFIVLPSSGQTTDFPGVGHWRSHVSEAAGWLNISTFIVPYAAFSHYTAIAKALRDAMRCDQADAILRLF